jgi:hypothetical protein
MLVRRLAAWVVIPMLLNVLWAVKLSDVRTYDSRRKNASSQRGRKRFHDKRDSPIATDLSDVEHAARG